VAVFTLLASRRRWWLWLGLTIVILVPALVSTGDWDAALAGFLAIGITVSGGVVFGGRWWPAYLLIASAVLLALVLRRTPGPPSGCCSTFWRSAD
jgi:hypothetical protein